MSGNGAPRVYLAVIHGSVGEQNAANTVYSYIDAAMTAGAPKQFRSDYERMQYNAGKQGVGCAGSGVGANPSRPLRPLRGTG